MRWAALSAQARWLLVAWIVATLLPFALLFLIGQTDFNGPSTLMVSAVLLLCTVALLRWARSPLHDDPNNEETRTGLLVVLMVATVTVLLALRALAGPLLLLAFPVIAGLALIILRPRLARAEWLYAAGLALVAALTGLFAGWIETYPLPAWAALQFALVLLGLPAGWAILKHSRLRDQGVGHTRLGEAGWAAGARAFGFGLLLAMPWALGNVVMGAANSESWVRALWQPLIAIQPAISEEVWGRILLVALLYLLFRRAARPRLALTCALFVAAYWFAYLHTSGGLRALPGTLIVGTLFALPLAYLALYRDLETAIGFHFWVDFIKFLVALLFINHV